MRKAPAFDRSFGRLAVDYLDLIQAAWGLSDREMERIIGLSRGWLRAWRNHEVELGPDEIKAVSRLLRFHRAVRLVNFGNPPDYAAWWRRVWRDGSVIGRRSPLQAVLAERGPLMDKLEQYFWGVAA